MSSDESLLFHPDGNIAALRPTNVGRSKRATYRRAADHSRAAKNQNEFKRTMTRGAAKFEVPAGPYAPKPLGLARRLWLSAELFQLPTEHALN